MEVNTNKRIRRAARKLAFIGKEDKVLSEDAEENSSYIHNDDIVEEEVDDDEYTPREFKRRSSVKPRSRKKFNTNWMRLSMFKGWLRKHPDPERAMCGVCNTVMSAGKSELEKHATSMKHQKNSAALRENQPNVDCISENQNLMLDNNSSMGCDENSSFIQNGSPLKMWLDDYDSPEDEPKPVSEKKFRSEWIEFPMFKGWLRAHPKPERAICRACNCVLKAGKSELKKHASSMKHEKKMIEFKKNQSNVENISENVVIADVSSVKDDEMSSFLQNNDGADTVVYSSEDNFGDKRITIHSSPIPGSGKMPKDSSLIKAIVTKPAPPWTATAIINGHVTRLELNDYKGRYLILFFYPQDFSVVCPTEILALSDRVLDFRAIQTEIVACSVDSHLSHLAWARTPRDEGGLGNPKIPLLSDPTHSIARDYGVLLPDSGHSLRAHFIIDRQGVLRHMMVNDVGVGRSIEDLLRTTQALRHIDETNTECPADWKPGLACV